MLVSILHIGTYKAYSSNFVFFSRRGISKIKLKIINEEVTGIHIFIYIYDEN